MTRRRAGVRSEEGGSVVTAILVIGVMLGLGFGTYSFVGGQQNQSRIERVDESSFNLSEGALASQAFLLSSAGWPGTATAAFGQSCTPQTTDNRCPDEESMNASFDQPDYAADTSWTTHVRDDAPAGTPCLEEPQGDPFYDEAVLANPTWDANCNGEMWIRSEGLVRGERRVVVGRVKVEEVVEEFPENVITAGKFNTDNNGNKVIVDRQGAASAPAPLAVRCSSATTGCATYRPPKQNQPWGQIKPDGVAFDWPGETFGDAHAVDRLRAKAQALGTHYETCPSSSSLTSSARIVFIENGDCSYQGNGTFNSAAAPGLLVVGSGKLRFSGSTKFYGLIYLANLDRSTDADVLDLHGNAHVYGAVAVDYGGGVDVGASGQGGNLVYDSKIFEDPVPLTSYGSAGILQNTFRELPAG